MPLRPRKSYLVSVPPRRACSVRRLAHGGARRAARGHRAQRAVGRRHNQSQPAWERSLARCCRRTLNDCADPARRRFRSPTCSLLDSWTSSTASSSVRSGCRNPPVDASMPLKWRVSWFTSRLPGARSRPLRRRRPSSGASRTNLTRASTSSRARSRKQALCVGRSAGLLDELAHEITCIPAVVLEPAARLLEPCHGGAGDGSFSAA